MKIKVKTLQDIDKFLGIPACFLLSFFRRLLFPFFTSKRKYVRKIIFIKLSDPESIILASSAIQRAVKEVGRENVFFLIFEENLPILNILNLIPLKNIFIIQTHSLWSMVKSCFKKIRMMRKHHMDTCIDMEFFCRYTAVISCLSGAATRVGFHSFFCDVPYRGDLFTNRLTYNPHQHTSQTFMSMVEALFHKDEYEQNFPVILQKNFCIPKYFPTTLEAEDCYDLLKIEGIPTNYKRILLHPNTNDHFSQRTWELRNYVTLSKLLLNKFKDYIIIMIGDYSHLEREWAVPIINEQLQQSRCFSLNGKLHLRQMMFLYFYSHLLITSDSSYAHFSALTNLKSITLFGPTTPFLHHPLSKNNHVIYNKIACSPCLSALNNMQTNCRTNSCMKNIQVEEVFNKSCSLLNDQ